MRGTEDTIYIIKFDSIYKIGITADTKRRMIQLGVSNAKIIKEEKVQSVSMCEHILHKRFSNKRIQHKKSVCGCTEWFRLNNEDLIIAVTFIDDFKKDASSTIMKNLEFIGT